MNLLIINIYFVIKKYQYLYIYINPENFGFIKRNVNHSLGIKYCNIVMIELRLVYK